MISPSLNKLMGFAGRQKNMEGGKYNNFELMILCYHVFPKFGEKYLKNKWIYEMKVL